MKLKVIISILLFILIYSCDNEYTSFREEPDYKNINSVTLHPNSPVLITDGVAELTFLVKAYMDVEHKRFIEISQSDSTIVVDSIFKTTTEVLMERIPSSEIKILSSNGETIENFKYRTTNNSGSEMEFTCTINGITSEPCKVKLISRNNIDEEILTIPIIFHLLPTNSQAVKYEGITTEYLQKIIDRANKVFSGGFSNSPAAVDTKIRFVLATTNANGNQLLNPGINRVEMGTRSNSEVTAYMNESLLWDPNKFINIYINSHIYGNTCIGPRFLLNNGSELLGYEKLVTLVDDPHEAIFSSYNQVGFTINISNIYSLHEDDTENRFEYLLGYYLGLIPTIHVTSGTVTFPYVDGDVDYCSDTYTYRQGPIRTMKYTYSSDPDEPRIYYHSINIMDGTSASTTITYEQAIRLRHVMKNCPGRMFGN